MVHIAYDKENHGILVFLINNSEVINPTEVFNGFENYVYKTTNIQPPLSNYKNYKVELDGEEIVGYLNIR